MNRLVRYFPDADLRKGYDGLWEIAKKEGVDLLKLPKGHFVGFSNSKRTKIKLCAQNDVMAYLRVKKGTIDPAVIARLPEYFNGETIEYDKAIKDVFKKKFPKWFEDKKP